MTRVHESLAHRGFEQREQRREVVARVDDHDRAQEYAEPLERDRDVPAD